MRAFVAACLLALPSIPWARDVPVPVEAALERAGIPLSAVGLVVEPVEGGQALASHQAAASFNPASVMKLVTSYAALDLLGPGFTFHTDVYASGELAGGVLSGDLAVRGGGDPKLTAGLLWQLAHELRSRGIREIRGDLIVDRGYFASIAHDPGRFDNEPHRAYNAGPDAFLVNYHAVDFRFIPMDNTVRVTAEPDLPNVEIVSRVRPNAEPCGAWRRDLRYEVDEKGLLATVFFSGSYPRECGEKTFSLSLFDDGRFTESMLRWIWSETGGVLRGRVRAGAVPEGAKLVYRYESEPLASLVREMNKNSNNVMARNIFLAISAERAGSPGEAAASERLVREWLATKRIDPAGISIDNGSGLARTDRISAGALAALLRSIWSSPLMPDLAASLPIYGTDGTLKSRKASASAGYAHVKGGTLNGVQAIAGFVLDRNGKRLIVVMLINHPNANGAQPAIDALIDWARARVLGPGPAPGAHGRPR